MLDNRNKQFKHQKMESNLSPARVQATLNLLANIKKCKDTAQIRARAKELAESLSPGDNRIYSEKYGLKALKILKIIEGDGTAKGFTITPNLDITPQLVNTFHYVMNNCHQHPDRCITKMVSQGYLYDVNHFPSDANWADGKPKSDIKQEQSIQITLKWVAPNNEKYNSTVEFLNFLKSLDGQEINMDALIEESKKLYMVTKALRTALLAMKIVKLIRRGTYQVTSKNLHIDKDVVNCYTILQSKVYNNKIDRQAIVDLVKQVCNIVISPKDIIAKNPIKTPRKVFTRKNSTKQFSNMGGEIQDSPILIQSFVPAEKQAKPVEQATEQLEEDEESVKYTIQQLFNILAIRINGKLVIGRTTLHKITHIKFICIPYCLEEILMYCDDILVSTYTLSKRNPAKSISITGLTDGFLISLQS